MRTVILAAVLITMAQPGFSENRKHMNTTIDISYGIVESVEQKKIDSNLGKNAVIGGVLGAAVGGHHHRGKNAAAGVLAGGLLTAMFEGNRKANAYRIRTMTGNEKMVVTEQMGIRVGDCVSVEEGPSTNLRRVQPVYCEHHDHEIMSDPMVQSKGQESAAECHAAKSMLLKAANEQEMEISLKKVKVFCN